MIKQTKVLITLFSIGILIAIDILFVIGLFEEIVQLLNICTALTGN